MGILSDIRLFVEIVNVKTSWNWSSAILGFSFCESLNYSGICPGGDLSFFIYRGGGITRWGPKIP